ncbi:MAG: LysE family translocator [Verrucomicrobiaceae bacterium]|nr:LysE family translocator [Verrucomicrobiaceae bacterium]
MLLGQFSPGPDFLLILKNALNHGRKASFFTAAGISLGLMIHCTLAIAGLGFLFNSSESLGQVLRFAGAAYLVYLSARLLISTRSSSTPPPNPQYKQSNLPCLSAFRQGFLTNLLNPKVAVFISAMLARFLEPESTLAEKSLYGTIIVVQGAVFWALFANILQAAPIRNAFLRYQRRLNVGFALLLIAAAITAIS